MQRRITDIRHLDNTYHASARRSNLASDYGPPALARLNLNKQAAGAIGREADALTGADSL